MSWTTVIGGLFKPLSDAYTSRQERIKAQESIKGKIQLAKDGHTTNVNLTDAEWEIVKASSEGGTWKDEYVTILITFPYLLIIVGAVWMVCFGDPSILNSGVLAIKTMNEVGIPIAFLMQSVVLAAIGLKVWRK